MNNLSVVYINGNGFTASLWFLPYNSYLRSLLKHNNSILIHELNNNLTCIYIFIAYNSQFFSIFIKKKILF